MPKIKIHEKHGKADIDLMINAKPVRVSVGKEITADTSVMSALEGANISFEVIPEPKRAPRRKATKK